VEEPLAPRLRIDIDLGMRLDVHFDHAHPLVFHHDAIAVRRRDRLVLRGRYRRCSHQCGCDQRHLEKSIHETSPRAAHWNTIRSADSWLYGDGPIKRNKASVVAI